MYILKGSGCNKRISRNNTEHRWTKTNTDFTCKLLDMILFFNRSCLRVSSGVRVLKIWQRRWNGSPRGWLNRQHDELNNNVTQFNKGHVTEEIISISSIATTTIEDDETSKHVTFVCPRFVRNRAALCESTNVANITTYHLCWQ